MRRSATSIPTNIAEGCGRRSDADLARFIDIALGSSKELEYLLMLAHDLGFLDQTRARECWTLNDEIQRMLAAFNRQLRTST
jgi:four helix bundle protein